MAAAESAWVPPPDARRRRRRLRATVECLAGNPLSNCVFCSGELGKTAVWRGCRERERKREEREWPVPPIQTRSFLDTPFSNLLPSFSPPNCRSRQRREAPPGGNLSSAGRRRETHVRHRRSAAGSGHPRVACHVSPASLSCRNKTDLPWAVPPPARRTLLYAMQVPSLPPHPAKR